MPMELIIPSHSNTDFNLDSACTSPYVSAPSSPPQFRHHFFSAPTSPTRAAAFYNDFADTDTDTATIPFHWEEKPGTPKSLNNNNNEKHDFVFEFSGQLDQLPTISAADELFHGGVIKTLKPPPGFSETHNSPKSKSPRKHKQTEFDFDPFAAAMQETCTKSVSAQNPKQQKSYNTRKKWRLKDLLLFRSVSEGHKDKFAMLRKNENVNSSSFRSTEGSVSSRRRASAHEWHYTTNRASAEEMRRKTFLPYKRGLLGCLGFNVPVVTQLSKGFGSS